MGLKRNNPFGKILLEGDFVKLATGWKADGDKVVFTNGVFDLLHPGHVLYLNEAKSQGTRLVVAVNSDRSVKALNKGPGRPYFGQQDRALMVSAIRCVDAVTIFDDDTPEQLIARIVPDVLVKGGDYRVEEIVGYRTVIEAGGVVKSLNFVEGYSSTHLENLIRGNDQ
ncbi:MAG: D-glycero-beta-D-manno-heptose 1-phosphate adenylyltransferase [Salibacteraceae bacterium]